jgi:hypothetical protein
MSACKHTKQNSWWEYDARGIPLCRVCIQCKHERLAKYRREVLVDGNYDADETIDEDYWDREYWY